MNQDTFSIPSFEALLEAEILDTSVTSDEEIEQQLRDLGADMEDLNERGAHFQNMADQPAWQSRAKAHITRRQQILERPPRERPLLSRNMLLSSIEQARHDPLFGQEIATYFRHRAPEEATDEELLGLLEDLETLRDLIEGNAQGDDE